MATVKPAAHVKAKITTYQVNGRTYNIPADKVASFLHQFKNPKKINDRLGLFKDTQKHTKKARTRLRPIINRP